MNSRATPTEDELVARAVQDLAQRTGFPVAFGGLLDTAGFAISAVHGARTRSLEGLVVQPERGLGGRAAVERRPRMTRDYGTSTSITHHYDAAVLGEGIETLLAIPVMVDGEARGVLYGGSWAGRALGEIAAAPAVQVADALAAELRVRDEVDRRVSHLVAGPKAERPAISAASREDLRADYAELRQIASALDDPALRARLEAVGRRLAAITDGDPVVPPNTEPLDTPLSPRELDVLACAALGGTNAEIASQLGLKPGTVKAYLGTAMSKLGAKTRHAAVARARRAGMLP